MMNREAKLLTAALAIDVEKLLEIAFIFRVDVMNQLNYEANIFYITTRDINVALLR